MNILKPNIFSNYNVLTGYTEINLQINPKLTKGLNFRFKYLEDYNTSKILLAKQNHVVASQIKIGKQVHGSEVAVVEESTNTEILDVDGLITNKANIMLGAKSADCCVVLLFDPVEKVAAVIHSGRLGTEKNIVAMGINKMKTVFGVNSENILAYLCPTATIDTYTVDASVAETWPDEFKKVFKTEQIQNLDSEIQKIILKNVSLSRSKSTYCLDITGRIKYDLVMSGVKAENIENSGLDTITNPLYHSSRREGADFRLGLGFIMMN